MAGEPSAAPLAHGALKPGLIDRAVIAVTSRLPDNWLGLRLAILLRRAVTMRLSAGALDVERWGLKLRLHPRDNGCEKNLLFTPQMYETTELAALAAEIDRAGPVRPFVFVDIGANVGLFSLFTAARANRNACILAIEPEPGNRARLAFNLASNPGLPIRSVPVALGAEEGELALEIDSRDRGGTRTHALKASTTDVLKVPSTTLLHLLQEQGIVAVDALKIDIEGNEAEVLAPFFRDTPQSLWPRLMLIEDSRTLWPLDLFALMRERGYRVTARSHQNVVLRREPPAGAG
jgi:FkbM family methyltransferase